MNLEKLNALKNKGNYTFQQISDLTNIPLSTLNRIFKGESSPTFDNVAAIARAIGGDLNDLADLQNSRSSEEMLDFLMKSLNSVYTRSSQNSTPNSNATNLHSSQKRCCSFCISSSNASPTFQVQKSIFHQMTKPIQVTVILPLLLAISFSRNDDIHSSISGISNDLIGVIPTIGQ